MNDSYHFYFNNKVQEFLRIGICVNFAIAEYEESPRRLMLYAPTKGFFLKPE